MADFKRRFIINSLIICFSGQIGSGKTSISREIANHLGYPWVSFGDYVRALAKKNGLSATRDVLQDFGASLVKNKCEKFCKSVLNQADWHPGMNIILDGVRHVKILETIKQITAPSVVLLVYVDTSEKERKKRILLSRNTNLSDFKQHESHSTEIDVKIKLKKLANIVVVNNDCSLNEVCLDIISRLYSLY